MKANQKPERRSWFATLFGVVFSGLFLYVGIGVWFVAHDTVQGGQGFYVRLIISVLSFGLVYLFVRLAMTGRFSLLKRYLGRFLESGL